MWIHPDNGAASRNGINQRMNPKSCKKRSITEKKVPSKRRMEEMKEKKERDDKILERDQNGKKMPEMIMPVNDCDDRDERDPRYASWVKRWDEIGDEEEMYLASTREELYELIRKEETFKHNVSEKDTTRLGELMGSLLTYGRENIEELQLLQIEDEEEVSPNERSNEGKFAVLIYFQHRRIGWMVEEVLSRYREKKETLAGKVRMAKALRKENDKLRKSLEAMARERDELLGKCDSRRVEMKDASVSTETEVPDVEMADDPVPVLSSLQDIPQNLVGTLEEMFERKMGKFLSRVGLSLGKEQGDSTRPLNVGKAMGSHSSGNGTAPTPKGTKPWSEVVKRSRGKLQRDSIPSCEKKERKGAQASVVPITGEEPKSTGK